MNSGVKCFYNYFITIIIKIKLSVKIITKIITFIVTCKIGPSVLLNIGYVQIKQILLIVDKILYIDDDYQVTHKEII